MRQTLYELALYTGTAGGLLATKWLLEWQTVCYVEINKYCVKVLQQRIKDGLLDNAPIWDDARTFNGRPWARCVDIVTAGFPCQPFSSAGKRAGNDDNRNMWPDTIRIIREVMPPFVLLENVPGLLAPFRDNGYPVKPAYFGSILRDLAQSGYDARWRVLSAAEMGAPHKRDRVFVVAYSYNERRRRVLHYKKAACTRSGRSTLWGSALDSLDAIEYEFEERVGQPPVFGMDTRIPYRVDRLAAAGNGQVPAVVATVWKLLIGGQ